MIKKIIVLTFCSMLSIASYAQQDVLLSQYMFNNLLVNPAYAGSKRYASASLLYRNQWVKFEGAPKTFVATIHGPTRTRKVGLGLELAADKIGVTSRYDVYANYAYHMQLNEKLKLGLGLRGGISYFNAKLSELIVWDKPDALFDPSSVSNILPNFGAGAYLYGNKFYMGLSVPELLSYDPSRPASFDIKNNIVPKQVRHYFFTMGGAIELNPDFVLRPAMLIKYSQNTPVEFDFNLNLLIKKVLWIGGAYRTGDAAVGMIELQATRQLRIGYAYDFTTSQLKNYSNGSHEIMIGYDFGYDIMKIKTPRYF